MHVPRQKARHAKTVRSCGIHAIAPVGLAQIAHRVTATEADDRAERRWAYWLGVMAPLLAQRGRG
jgi:hypothetical protein